MFITRKEAISALSEVYNSGILKDDLDDAIYNAMQILIHEDEDNLSLWGAEDEASDLFVSMRSDLITEEWENHIDELYATYAMK